MRRGLAFEGTLSRGTDRGRAAYVPVSKLGGEIRLKLFCNSSLAPIDRPASCLANRLCRRRDPLASFAVKHAFGCLTLFLAVCTNENRCPIYGDRTGIGSLIEPPRDPTRHLSSFVPVELTQAFIHQGFAALFSRADFNVPGSWRRSRLPKPATFRPDERECREINGEKTDRDQACGKARRGEKGAQPPCFTIAKTAPDKGFGEKTFTPAERAIASKP